MKYWYLISKRYVMDDIPQVLCDTLEEANDTFLVLRYAHYTNPKAEKRNDQRLANIDIGTDPCAWICHKIRRSDGRVVDIAWIKDHELQ